MLSVGSNNGRKVLGFNVRGEMEENELEEGEAFYEDDDSPAIDEDAALSSLSYIDEKLHDVLGHFQKDFEGGVSAESLGAKFGIYGSFLPTCPRPPSVWSHESHPGAPPKIQTHESHPGAPPKMQTYGTSKSPKNFSPEGAHQNPMIGANSTLSVRVLPPGARSGPVATHVDKQTKRDIIPTANVSEEFIANQEHKNKSANNQKMPAVGSINFSTKNNAAIYSGLGLDISPPSSPEDDLDEDGGQSPGLVEIASESPMTILQTMTSFPVPGGCLLSPLPESLLCLTERSLPKASKAETAHKAIHEVPTMFPNELPPLTEMKGFGKMKMKPIEKNGRSMVVKIANGINSGSDVSSSLEKEIDRENPVSRELVSNASLLSRGTAEKMEKQSTVERAGLTNAVSDLFRDSNALRDRTVLSNVVKEEASDLIAVQETDRSSNIGNNFVPSKGKSIMNMILEDSMREEKQTANHIDISSLKKDDSDKGDKKSAVFDCDGSGGRKDNGNGSLGLPQQKASQKTMSYDQEGFKMSRKEGKKKHKRQQCNDILSSKYPKDKVELQSGDSISENKIDVAKLQQLGKTGGRENQQDSPGEVKAKHPANRMPLVEKHFKDKPKDQKMKIEKETITVPEKSKEKLAAKKVEILSTSEACAPIAALTMNGPTSSVLPLAGPPPLDSWVCCDRCQRWRLLPVGVNSDDLPEKWTCSMIDWLPGMNSCTYSEEETTKARNALYQLHLPENQNFLHGQCNGATPGMVLANCRDHNQRQEIGLHAMPSGEKKKIAAKDMSNSQNHANPMHVKSSNKKKQQTSVKSVALNDVDQQVRNSNDYAVEKPQHGQKEKKKIANCYPDGGGYVEKGIKQSKTKIKSDSDQDGYKISKKIKTESSQYANGDHLFDQIVTVKPITNSSNSMKSPQKQSDSSSAKELKGTIGGDMASSEKPKAQFQVSLDSEYKTQFETSGMGKFDKPDIAAKKRKVKEWQESQDYPVTLMNGGHLAENRISLNKEIGEIELRKEKKAKLSKSEGKVSGKSKADSSVDKKGRIAKIVIPSRGLQTDAMEEDSQGPRVGMGRALQPVKHQVTVVSHHMLDSIELLKRDLGDSQNLIAATSSSSKVSGSRKSKASCQEVKGSPVESVSSSPFRVSNVDKLTTERPNLVEKDSTINADQTQDRNADQISGMTTRVSMLTKTFDGASEYENDIAKSGAAILHQQNLYLTEVQGNGSADNDLKKPNDHHFASSSRQQKSGKGSSRSRGGPKSVGSDFSKGKCKNSEYLNNQVKPHLRKSTGSCEDKANGEASDCYPCHEGPSAEQLKFNESCSTKFCKDDKICLDKKDLKDKRSSEGRGDNQLKFGVHESRKEGRSIQQKLTQVTYCGNEKLYNGFLSSATDQAETAPGRAKEETNGHYSQVITHEGSISDKLPVDASNGDVPKVPKQLTKPDNLNGGQYSTSAGMPGRELDAPSPDKKGSDQAAAKALKEAKDIKHSANRLRDKGQELESTDLYFQASLKFLHAASLLEVCNVESAKHGETTQSMQVYTDTAKLFEFCAIKYEKFKEMAAAALAYKSMEVAHMRVIYCKNYIANRDWRELHAPLQVVPPGESPSSSASDVDNLNKGVISPQIAGNHIIAARNRPNFERLLKFTRDVDLAINALRRWQNAFASANAGVAEAPYGLEGISSVKRVLDFSFHDVEGLLRLVRLATEAIGR